MQSALRKLVVIMVLAMAASLLLSPAAYTEEEQPGKDAVAMVNGTPITQQEFDRQVQFVLQRFASTNQMTPDPSMIAELKKSVLDKMIDAELLYQQSKKEKISIDNAKVDQELQNFKDKVNNPEEYKKFLETLKMTESDLKSDFRRNLAIQQLIDKEVVNKITVSDEDAKKFYDENPDNFKQPELVKASHILVSVAPDADQATKDEARKKIESIEKELKGGADFAELAKKNSQCPSSKQGGDLGYFQRGQMVKPFEDAAFALKPGEVSGIVETRFGYHLIKVLDHKDASTVDFATVKDRIIQFLKQQKIQEKVEDYVEKLRAKADIKRMLAEEKETK